MAMMFADDGFEVPAFLKSHRGVPAVYEAARPRGMAERLRGIWGAIRWSLLAVSPRFFHPSEDIMSDMQEVPSGHRRIPFNGQQGAAPQPQGAAQPGPQVSDPMQALSAIVQRIRILDGEKQANAILAGMLDASNQVLAKFGAAPMDHRSAELESLHDQLRRFQDNARREHEAFLKLQAAANAAVRALSDIADGAIDGALVQDEARAAVKTWESAISS